MNLRKWHKIRSTHPGHAAAYNFAFIDEGAKREIRRKILKAVAIPGYGSRELPIARGWGIGGLQITLALIGPEEILKVIDQGSDDSVNAVNIRKFIQNVTGVALTTDTCKATLIQTRRTLGSGSNPRFSSSHSGTAKIGGTVGTKHPAHACRGRLQFHVVIPL